MNPHKINGELPRKKEDIPHGNRARGLTAHLLLAGAAGVKGCRARFSDSFEPRHSGSFSGVPTFLVSPMGHHLITARLQDRPDFAVERIKAL
jgi:hypothetical protein